MLKNLKSYLRKPNLIYPLVILLVLPLLLVVNTLWNLQSFNQDVNYLIRHQAISISDTLKPFILQALTDKQDLAFVLKSAKEANKEIVSITLYERKTKDLVIIERTDTKSDAAKESKEALNQLALSLNQPFAALIYDPVVQDKIWNVVVPLDIDKTNSYLLQLKMKRTSVENILNRTSRDSITILVITVIAALLLLINHFTFYQKAIMAQKLAEVDKLKDEFISMASHELRAPVGALRGYIEMMQTKLPKEAVQQVDKEIGRIKLLLDGLSELINDLLDVSRIEQGRLQTTMAPTDVGKIINEVVQSLTPQAEEKHLKLNVDIQSFPTISTDALRVRQVLTNLISNAVKYSLQGTVDIKAVKEASSIMITVKDTGIGIPADKLPLLFDKFYRVKDDKTAAVQGTGLGLWITRQIVEKLGGKIYAESIYGTGSVFTFTLPAK